jgi:hypothetical protein
MVNGNFSLFWSKSFQIFGAALQPWSAHHVRIIKVKNGTIGKSGKP